METRVPADDGGWRRPSGGPVENAVEQRLAAIEQRLAALEASITDAVEEGLQSAGDEMRRAVSDLGRLLLRDLDRLTRVLAEHRDTIVDRLKSDEAPSGLADPSGGPAPAQAADPVRRVAGEPGRWKAFPPRRRRRRGR